MVLAYRKIVLMLSIVLLSHHIYTFKLVSLYQESVMNSIDLGKGYQRRKLSQVTWCFSKLIVMILRLTPWGTMVFILAMAR